MPRIVFDFVKLSSIQDDTSRPAELFFLSPAAVSALSQLREMLLWHNTRWVNGTLEEIRDFSSDLHDQMSTPLHLNDLIAALNALEFCCGTPDNVPVSIPGTEFNEHGGDDIEDETGDPPAEHGEEVITTWAEWLIQKCNAAALMAKAPALVMERIELVKDNRGEPGYAEAMALVIASIPGIGPAIAAAWVTFLEFVDPLIDFAFNFTTAISELQAAESDFMCALWQATTVDEAAADMSAVAQAALSGSLAKLLALVFPWRMYATSVYTGTMLEADGTEVYLSDSSLWVDPATCDCLEPFDFLAVWDDDLDVEPWNLQGRAEFGGDASCPDTGNVKMNPCTAGNAIARNILENAADKASFTWPGTPRVGYVDYFEVTYICGDTYASEGKTLQQMILYEDGSSDVDVLPVTPGEHTVFMEGDHEKEVQANIATNQYCVQLREENTVGLCNDIDAQVCFVGARVWGRVSGT